MYIHTHVPWSKHGTCPMVNHSIKGNNGNPGHRYTNTQVPIHGLMTIPKMTKPSNLGLIS